MAQLEELRIKFQDDVSAGANAAAAALTKVGQAADGATEEMRQTDEVVKRVGTSAEQLARKYIEAERATALREQSERRHARALADVAAAEQAGSVTAERAAQLRTEIARRAELDSARIVAASERRQQAESRALGGGVGLGGASSIGAAEAQLTRLSAANDNATRSTGRLGAVMGQAGFQIQDFATQVSMGQNAVTAFAVQGAQLLGVFGTGGAIAGAVLTVGTLAYQLFSARDATDALREAQDRLSRTFQSSTEFFETATERARRLAQEQRATIALGFSAESSRIERETQALERAVELNERQRREIIDSNRNLPGFNPDTVLADVLARQRQEIETNRAAIAELDRQRERALTAPSGADRDEAARDQRQREEQARREAEQRARQREREDEQQSERQRMRVQNAVQQDTARREREEREAQERIQRDEARALEERERENRRVTDDIVRYGADRFADLFDRNGQGFKGLMRTFETTARQTFARIAAEAVIRPIIAPIVSGLGLGGLGGGSGAAAGGGGLSSLLSGAGMLGNAGSLFSGGADMLGLGGLGGVSGFLSAPIFGQAALTSATNSALGGLGAGVYGPATAAQVGLPGVSFGGALAGIGGGFALGSFAGGLVAGRSQARQTNAQIGAGIGAVGGFLIGGPFGAVIGGGLGGLGGGLIGPGPKTNAYGFSLNAADGRFNAGGLQTTGTGAGGDQALAEAQAYAQQVNAFLEANRITVATGNRVINGRGNSEDQSATVNDAFSVFRFSSAAGGTLGRVLNDRSFAGADALTSAVSFADAYDTLANIKKPTDAWAQQIEALNKTFEEASKKAKEYGLATDVLTTAQAKAIAQVNAQRENTILGALVQQSRILTGFLDSRVATTGSAQSQFTAAQSGFDTALSAARLAGQGSADLNRVVGAANTLLQANASFNGSGAQAAAIESMVRSQITALGGQLDLPGFTQDITGAIYRAGELQLDQLKLLNDSNAALREEIRGLRLVVERAQAA